MPKIIALHNFIDSIRILNVFKKILLINIIYNQDAYFFELGHVSDANLICNHLQPFSSVCSEELIIPGDECTSNRFKK